MAKKLYEIAEKIRCEKIGSDEFLGVKKNLKNFYNKTESKNINTQLGKITLYFENYLKKRLFERGYTDNFDGVLEDKALAHIAFAGPGVAIQKARDGVRELLSRIGKYQLEEQIALATNAVMDDLNEVNWNRLSSLRAALVSVNGGSNLEDPV